MLGITLLLALALSPQAKVLEDITFAKVDAGDYTVGEKGHHRNPLRQIRLNTFEIATTEITNAQFALFIDASEYITDAEKNGFGMTFKEGMDDWEWESTPGATWRKPFGPMQYGIEDKENHPVTQISFNDAQAFCTWADLRLPTVDEWEVAARAGQSARWPWGSTFAPESEHRANTWQGVSHHKNTLDDRFLFTAPVASYPPNALGLYDVIGNVFEYCVDDNLRDSNGVLYAAGRGGSWWCSSGTCNFYNLVDIGQVHPKATLPNQGFRVVRNAATPHPLPDNSPQDATLPNAPATDHSAHSSTNPAPSDSSETR